MSDAPRCPAWQPRPSGHIWTEADARELALVLCPGDVFGDGAFCTEPCEGCIESAWSDLNEPPRRLSDYPDAQIGRRLLAKLRAEGQR